MPFAFCLAALKYSNLASMNDANVSEDEMMEAAFGALQILKDNLPENCKLSVENEYNVVFTALKRHSEHLNTHAVRQKHIDPFKLLCWVGCALIQGLEKGESYHQFEQILEALINGLEEMLMLETNSKVRLPKPDRILIHSLMMEEIKNNPDHGIGFNGLFVAFHCFRSSYKQLSV